MLKKMFILITLFTFIILTNIDAEDKTTQSFLEQHKNQSNQINYTKNSFITEINSHIYFFPKDLNIVTLGDSLTQGVGDESHNSGYVGMIEDNLDGQVKIDNFGISGYRSDQLYKLIDEPDVEASLTNADVVLMTIGANDIMKVFRNNFTHLKIEPFVDELDAFEGRLKKIFTKINQINPQTKIYLIGFYDPFSEYFPEVKELTDITSTWNERSAEITKEFDYTYYIPTKQLFEKDVGNYLAEDKFHPNNKGYTKIATEIVEHIKSGVGDAYETE